MIIAGKTDRGKVRVTNQDDFAVGYLPGSAVYAVVCDGMGGANGGNVASSTAVRIISKEIAGGYNESLDDEGIKKLLMLAVGKANNAVFEMSRKDHSLLGMGTTVVAAVASGGSVSVAHAGDSRAYLIDDGIKQLTRDHSIVQEMLENGKITQDEALIHPQKNIITRALGVEESLDIDFKMVQFGADGAVLICTDGLTNLITDEALQITVKESNKEQCAEKLVNMANDNGGSDNITVVVIYNAQTGGEIDG
jgi:PPM family protein phosphatase